MGEFEDLNRQRGVIAQLRGLNARAWAAIGCGVIVLLLIVAAIAGPGTPGSSTAAASRPLPMTPTGGYTVGESYYADAIPMPDYRFWMIGNAVDDLARRGIVVYLAAGADRTAVVQSQNPYPGTRIKQSTASAIQLMVPAAETTTTTTPPPTTTTTAAPSQTDVDIDIDDDTNLPDGALTGGYCKRKWWC